MGRMCYCVVHKILSMIQAKDTIYCYRKLFQNVSLRLIFGCFNMFKCIQRFYADTVASYSILTFSLISLNYTILIQFP